MTTTEPVIRTAEQRAESSRILGRLSLIPIATAALMGWSASFIGLHGFATVKMTGFTVDTAWLVPGAIDLAAFGCTILVYRASINGRSGFASRALMYLFTALSAWINWIHQDNGAARFVACVLPVAAVLVFDRLAGEIRADWEADHGRTAFRMRLPLLLLRYFVDRKGTKAAFREQITAIPVSALVGLGANLATAATIEQPAPLVVPEPEPPMTEPVLEPEQPPALPSTDADLLLAAEPPAWAGMTTQAAIERADAILPGRTGQDIANVLGKVGIATSDSYVRTVRRRLREQHARELEQRQHDADVIPFQRESAHGA
jgi:hypothetical protein